MEWANEHKAAILFAEIIAGVWLITSAPELRSLKTRMKLLASVAAVFSLFYFELSSIPIYDILFKLVLVRPVFFVCGLLWSGVTGYYTSRAMESLYDASEDSSSIPCTSNFSMPRYFRQIGRFNLALAETKRRLKSNPNDVEGNYLLACLHAEDMKDIHAAYAVVKGVIGNIAVSHAIKELMLTHYEGWRLKLCPYDASLKLAIPSATLPKAVSALQTARELRARGEPKQAAALLQKQLKNDPSDYTALLLGMRIYAEDLKDLASAEAWLAKIQALRPLPSGYCEFAKASMDAWKNNKAAPQQVVEAEPPVVTPRLDYGYINSKQHRDNARYGTAIECIQNHLKECPGDFEGLFLMASIYAENCDDLHSADKIIKQIERIDSISKEEKALACGQMKKWREAHRKMNSRPS